MREITTGQLGAALGVTARAVRDAVEAEVPHFGWYTYTPGGQLRWSPERAAEIVRAHRREPPAEWLPPAAASVVRQARKASAGKGAR